MPTRELSPTELQEHEANLFATALLMPLPLVRAELDKVQAELPHPQIESVVERLAERFQVSVARMAMRLKDLEERL